MRVFPSPPAALASLAVLVSSVFLQELSRDSGVLGIMALSHTIHPKNWCQPDEGRLSDGWWIFHGAKGPMRKWPTKAVPASLQLLKSRLLSKG